MVLIPDTIKFLPIVLAKLIFPDADAFVYVEGNVVLTSAVPAKTIGALFSNICDAIAVVPVGLPIFSLKIVVCECSKLHTKTKSGSKNFFI
jgi:hypothetical protein